TLLCVSGGFRRQGVTDYLRLGREARYVTRHRIEGTHYTHIMRGSDRIAPPYVASQTLVFDGSGWRFCEARYAILNDALPFTFPEAGTNPDRLPFHSAGASRTGCVPPFVNNRSRRAPECRPPIRRGRPEMTDFTYSVDADGVATIA